MSPLRTTHIARAFAVLAAGALIPAVTSTGAAMADEITVTVISVKAYDKVDELSGGDFFAKVTIDGEAQSTPVVKDKKFKPDWKISKHVSSGEHKVKLELIDKDLAEDDPIDINKLDNKRDLEFTVDTRTCKIEGFSSTQRCGTTITRVGKEKKRAEIAFKVNVKEK
jgi:hypothetical protein